jgi:integrase
MTLSSEDIRKLIAEEVSNTVANAGGIYVLVPPGSSRSIPARIRPLGASETPGGYSPSPIGSPGKGVRPLAGTAAQVPDIFHEPLAALETFEDVAREWFENNVNRWVPTYLVRKKSRLEADLIPALGKRYIADIAPMEVLHAVRAVENRGAVESAKRIMHMASAVFRYGVATGRCHRDPTTDLKDALKPALAPKRRTALPAKDLPGFTKALESYDGDIVTKLALKLTVLTFVRTGEIRFAKWSELENMEGREPLWRISADRMKMRRPHLVPLAPQAVAVLDELRRYTARSPYLFPANTKLGVVSENTLLFALYRMGYHSRATVHGFRSTASTVLNEAQFNRDWIELQLAHTDDTIRGVYNSAEWLPGRRKMMNWWADYIEGSVSALPHDSDVG